MATTDPDDTREACNAVLELLGAMLADGRLRDNPPGPPGGMVQNFALAVEYIDGDGEQRLTFLVPDDAALSHTLGLWHFAQVFIERQVHEVLGDDLG